MTSAQKVALLVTPVLLVWTRINPNVAFLWPARLGPWWLPLIPVLAMAMPLLLPLQARAMLREPAVTRLRAQGREPRQAVAMVGSTFLLSPVSIAWFCSFWGLPVWQLVAYSAFSTLGVALWMWRYR